MVNACCTRWGRGLYAEGYVHWPFVLSYPRKSNFNWRLMHPRRYTYGQPNISIIASCFCSSQHFTFWDAYSFRYEWMLLSPVSEPRAMCEWWQWLHMWMPIRMGRHQLWNRYVTSILYRPYATQRVNDDNGYSCECQAFGPTKPTVEQVGNGNSII